MRQHDSDRSQYCPPTYLTPTVINQSHLKGHWVPKVNVAFWGLNTAETN